MSDLSLELEAPEGTSDFSARSVPLPGDLEAHARLVEDYSRPVVTHNRSDEFDPGEHGHVYIGRHTWQGDRVTLWSFLRRELPGPMRGWLGNPWPVDAHCSRGESIGRYRQLLEWAIGADDVLLEGVRSLSGCTLGCWCRSSEETEPACHGDVLAEFCRRLWEGRCADDAHQPAAFPLPRWSRHWLPSRPYVVRCRRCYALDAGPVVLSESSELPIVTPPPGGAP